MALIKSISGIRGTIGGKEGGNLTPLDIVKFTAAFVSFIKARSSKKQVKLVVGRDARISGAMANHMVVGTALSLGADIIDAGLTTTPTVEIAVPLADADGGIILTASHNPKEWNALKLLNEKGEFISAQDGQELLELISENKFSFNQVDELGVYYLDQSFNEEHIQQVLAMPLVNVDLIRAANFKVAVDCVNSTGGIVLPKLLKQLGVEQIEKLYCDPTGDFPHNPEPLPENLKEISALMTTQKADVGFVVDPDVDRLAIVCEDGSMFGEEYTLVAVADYILQHKKGNTVSNLSSTRALRDVTEKHGGTYYASAVGEVNVVDKMKEVNAVIGGEGNGGIIDPVLHYGRDALVGIALFLTHLAKTKLKCSELRKSYPDYYISKNKIELSPKLNVDKILEKMEEKYKNVPHSTIDGLKIDFKDEWVHLRKSNTEAIIRIYAESKSSDKANELAEKVMQEINAIIC